MAARMDHLSAALRDVQMVHDSDDLDDIEEKLPPPPLHARDVSQGSQESDSRLAPSTADTEEDDEGERLHRQHLQRQHHMMMNAQQHQQHQPPPSMLAMAQSRQLKSASSSPQATKMLLRPNSSQSIIETGSITSSTTTAGPYEQRRRLGTNSIGSNSSASIGSVMVRGGVKPSTDERTGFARIYFENQNFTSSTVFKLFVNTTVLEVRKSMANKIKIPASDFSYYVIVVVFPNENTAALSARTLRDDELILPLIESLNQARPKVAEVDEAAGTLRAKPKHRSRSSVKFILKDIRGAPLDLDQESKRKAPSSSDNHALNFPVYLGKGVHCGYLQKASVKDINVWRKRWFIVKDDQLLYCKSATNQRDVTAVSLLDAYLAKARAEVSVPYSFELRTPRRIYQLCANSKDDMVAWIHALHVQIGICTENHRIHEAEILITEDAVTRSEEEAYSSSHVEPSLLQRVLSREDTRKIFRDFAYTTNTQALLDAWIECELFRRSCLARDSAAPVTASQRSARRTAKDEWEHLKAIVRAIQALPMIQQEEVLQLRQSFQSEQLSRRLSLALHAETNLEYPRVELIIPIHQRIFEAIEAGPFQQFLSQNGYRLLLERVIGRIA